MHTRVIANIKSTCGTYTLTCSLLHKKLFPSSHGCVWLANLDSFMSLLWHTSQEEAVSGCPYVCPPQSGHLSTAGLSHIHVRH